MVSVGKPSVNLIKVGKTRDPYKVFRRTSRPRKHQHKINKGIVVAKTKLALFQPKRAFKLMASPPTPPEAILFLTKSEL